MQFKTIALLGLAAVAGAQDLSAFESDLKQYFASLEQDPSFVQAAQSLATDPALMSSISALAQHADPSALAGGVPSAISALPSQYRGLFESVYSHEMSIASKDGILSDGRLVISTGAVGSAVGTAASQAVTAKTKSAGDSSSVTGSTTNSGGSSTATTASTHSSSAMAPAQTGVMAMGAFAGVIGMAAVLL